MYTHTDAIARQYPDMFPPFPSLHSISFNPVFFFPVFSFIFTSSFAFSGGPVRLFFREPYNADKANKEPSGETGQCYGFISAQKTPSDAERGGEGRSEGRRGKRQRRRGMKGKEVEENIEGKDE